MEFFCFSHQGKLHGTKPLLPLNPGLAGIAALEDPSPEAMHLKLKFSSVAITILHVDPVLSPVSDTEDQSQDDANNLSSHPLMQMADKFFSGLGTYGFGGKDFEDMKERLAEACPNDHLRYFIRRLFVFNYNVFDEHVHSNTAELAGSVG
jgi:hypothetical protein